MIEVRLFATFREGRGKAVQLDFSGFKDAKAVAKHLEIPLTEIAVLLINGRHSSPDEPLHDGDVIALFPPVGGG